MEDRPVARAFGWWLLCALAAAVATFVSLRWLDVPLARTFAGNIAGAAPLSRGLGSAVLICGEVLVMAALVVIRLWLGHLPPFGKAVLVAIAASLTAYAFNDAVLKLFFGMPGVGEFLTYNRPHRFHILHGSPDDSFPSGHMALAASFAFALARLDRRVRWPMALGLLLAATALLLGDFHFLSDVIAGTFVGATAGLAAGELWMQHANLTGLSGIIIPYHKSAGFCYILLTGEGRTPISRRLSHGTAS